MSVSDEQQIVTQQLALAAVTAKQRPPDKVEFEDKGTSLLTIRHVCISVFDEKLILLVFLNI